jgi:hypothetical protein
MKGGESLRQKGVVNNPTTKHFPLALLYQHQSTSRYLSLSLKHPTVGHIDKYSPKLPKWRPTTTTTSSQSRPRDTRSERREQWMNTIRWVCCYFLSRCILIHSNLICICLFLFFLVCCESITVHVCSEPLESQEGVIQTQRLSKRWCIFQIISRQFCSFTIVYLSVCKTKTLSFYSSSFSCYSPLCNGFVNSTSSAGLRRES